MQVCKIDTAPSLQCAILIFNCHRRDLCPLTMQSPQQSHDKQTNRTYCLYISPELCGDRFTRGNSCFAARCDRETTSADEWARRETKGAAESSALVSMTNSFLSACNSGGCDLFQYRMPALQLMRAATLAAQRTNNLWVKNPTSANCCRQRTILIRQPLDDALIACANLRCG
jgi:hypothetical protein